MNDDDFGSPRDSVSTIIFEMSALNAALSAIDAGLDIEEARTLVRSALKRKSVPETLDEHVVIAAMRRISGEVVVVPSVKIHKDPWDRRLADVTATSWLAWAKGEFTPALSQLPPLLRDHDERDKIPGEDGAIQLLSISFWGEAVVQLAKGDLVAAHRFFRRALELGSQFGTETHPIVSWSYAASFFGERMPPKPGLSAEG